MPLIFLFLWSLSSFAYSHPFSEKEAFLMLFGNYNHVYKTATWSHINFPDTEATDSFWKHKSGLTSSVLFQPYKENKKNKIIFVTKTIPSDMPFDCHACLPLLSITIFVKDKNGWKVESQNPRLMYEGEYGVSPITKLVSIGKDKIGLLLEFEHRNSMTYDKMLALVIPYKNTVSIAHQEIISYHNFNSCRCSFTCTAFTASISFDISTQAPFYHLKIKRFGTKNNSIQKDKAVPVDEEITYHFVRGKYIQAS